MKTILQISTLIFIFMAPSVCQAQIPGFGRAKQKVQRDIRTIYWHSVNLSFFSALKKQQPHFIFYKNRFKDLETSSLLTFFKPMTLKQKP